MCIRDRLSTDFKEFKEHALRTGSFGTDRKFPRCTSSAVGKAILQILFCCIPVVVESFSEAHASFWWARWVCISSLNLAPCPENLASCSEDLASCSEDLASCSEKLRILGGSDKEAHSFVTVLPFHVSRLLGGPLFCFACSSVTKQVEVSLDILCGERESSFWLVGDWQVSLGSLKENHLGERTKSQIWTFQFGVFRDASVLFRIINLYYFRKHKVNFGKLRKSTSDFSDWWNQDMISKVKALLKNATEDKLYCCLIIRKEKVYLIQ